MLKRWWQHYQNWWRSAQDTDRLIVVGVVLATLLGATYRLRVLPQTMQFFADQGRDALIAYGILHGDLALVGPSTSVGSMFLGPLYYYFMAPFLWLAAWSPLGPTVAVALIGILTIPALYWVGSRLVGRWPAWIATLLYASAPIVAEYTRFSWNPNPAPMVMLFLLYSVWRAWRGTAWWWVVVAGWFAVIIQLHYVALLAAAPAGIFWLADVIRTIRDQRKRARSLTLATGLSAGLVVASFLPLFLFNWKFDNIILNGFLDFFSREKGLTAVSPGQQFLSIFREQHGRGMQILFEIWAKEWFSGYRQLNTWLFGGYIALLSVGAAVFRRSKYRAGYWLVLLTVLTSILGLAFYKSTVFFHYFSYFYPISYLTTGLVIVLLVRVFRRLGRLMALALFGFVLWLSVQPTQLLYLRPLSWTYRDMAAVARQVETFVPAGKTYSLALLSEIRDYRGMNYRYFLVTGQHPPEPLETAHTAEYLVVIAETPRDEREVLSSPVYEISAFPKGEYTIYDLEGGPRVFVISRQVHTESDVIK